MRSCILLLFVALSTLATEIDVNTFSNYRFVAIQHIHLEWLLDLDHKYINATAEYQITVLADSTHEIWLDVYQLNIHKVYLQNGKPLEFNVALVPGQSIKQGDILMIHTDRTYRKGEKIVIRIGYSVDERARALGFLTKEQTDSKTLPYLYSYCQNNNCRSMIPLQDTPSRKQTLSAVVLVKDPRLKVYLTGKLLQGNHFKRMSHFGELETTLTAYHFNLDIAIPSYLFAIVAGNLAIRQIGQSQSYVICEVSCIDAAALELRDLQDYVDRLSAYIGPYKWGEYKIVIMPPSFPLGDMEHPLLTFASPTIIVGDQSSVNVAIHEIGHSWVGNTVTCANWQNLWINEGFCTFLERKILKQLKGESFVKIEGYLGTQSMISTINAYGKDNSYSSMHPDTINENPDDAVSIIPYDKGYQLLLYIERLMGENQFQQMLKDYIVHFEGMSIDYKDLYDYIIYWVNKNVTTNKLAIITGIQDNYMTWVLQPGEPPIPADFHTEEYDIAIQLAKDWLSMGGAAPANAAAFNQWEYNQKSITLTYILQNSAQVTVPIFEAMEAAYQLSDSKDSRIKYRWFNTQLRAQYYVNFEKIKVFLGSHGAKGWMLSMYGTLNQNRPVDAKAIFESFRYFYHKSVIYALENEVFIIENMDS